MTQTTTHPVQNLSAHARFTIKGGTASEWYARTDRAADELVSLDLAWRPFNHDARILVPTPAGLAVRAALQEAGDA